MIAREILQRVREIQVRTGRQVADVLAGEYVSVFKGRGVEFEEVTAPPSQDPEFLAKSPMGKVPCLETEHGYLTEVFAIADYLDHIQAEPPLLPTDPFARARASCSGSAYAMPSPK